MGGSAVCKVTVLDKFIWSVFGTQRLREQVSRRAQGETLPRGSVYPRPLWLRVELGERRVSGGKAGVPAGRKRLRAAPGQVGFPEPSPLESREFVFFFKYSWPRPWSWLLVQLFFLVNLC